MFASFSFLRRFNFATPVEALDNQNNAQLLHRRWNRQQKPTELLAIDA